MAVTSEASKLAERQSAGRTLAGRFNYYGSPKALQETADAAAELAFRLSQLRWACEESDAVLVRSQSSSERQRHSAYRRDARSTLPTFTYETVGRLVEFVGQLGGQIEDMREDSEKIHAYLCRLPDSSLIADEEGPLEDVLANLDEADAAEAEAAAA